MFTFPASLGSTTPSNLLFICIRCISLPFFLYIHNDDGWRGAVYDLGAIRTFETYGWAYLFRVGRLGRVNLWK